MHPFKQKSMAAAVATILMAGCAPAPVNQEEMARAVEGYIEDANKLFVVDCLLPGQLRKLGSQVTYLSARRAVRTTAADCEFRGGEYVAYDRANYATALKVWMPKAEQGDATAQLYVGEIYEKGLGQPADYAAAAKWYRKAAEQGNAQAQLNLGALYEKGLGVSRDSGTASNWYRKASGLEAADLAFAPAPSKISDAERAELQALRNSAQSSQEENAALREELKSVSALKERLAAAEQRAANAERKAGEGGQASRDAEQSRREAEQLRAQLRKAESRADAAERTAAQGGSASEQVEALRAELRSTQQKMLDQQDALRKSQDELGSMKEQLAQQKAAAPTADDPKLKDLEARLQAKEASLKKQQSKINDMAASFDKERKKLKQEITQAKQASASPAGTNKAAPSADGISELENSLQSKMDEYRKGSEELTALLTSGGDKNRAAIDQRKAQLQTQAREIAMLKEKSEREAGKAKERKSMEHEQLAQAGPRIDILDPEVTLTRGARTIQLKPSAKELVGRVQSPAELLSLLVNGQSLTPDSGGVFRFPLDANASATSLKIVATDKQKRQTDVDLSVMTSAGAATSSPVVGAADIGHADKPGDLALGKFYALIIGNNQYSAYPALQTAANDAQSLDVILRERYGFRTTLLVNANRHQIMTALNEMHKKLKAEDNLLIYYAGHGEIDKGTQAAYWLPTDAEVGNPANWISSQSITEFLSIMPARHIMVVADSCYSGALTGSAVAKLPEGMDESKRAKWLKVMATRKARTVLTSGGVKPVLDQGGGGHSVFANAFLAVLRSNKKILEDYDVFRAVAGQVNASASKAGFEQTPQYAPLQHSGHEGSPFFFVPENA